MMALMGGCGLLPEIRVRGVKVCSPRIGGEQLLPSTVVVVV